MPYKVMKQDDEWCVIKEDDGKRMGCHDSEDAAKKQVAALYASENKSIAEVKLEMHRLFSKQLDMLDALEMDALPDVPEPTTTEDTGHDHSDDTHTLYAAPDSNDSNILKALVDKFRGGLKPGNAIFKAADGKRYMLIVTSNSYKDREGETLRTDALKEDVARHWTAEDKAFMSNNPLLFWHDDRLPIGDIVWGDVRGPFYVELARERDDVISRKMWDVIEASDEAWGASHRFAYYSKDRNQDGDYRRVFKQETTVLPRKAAANLLTFSGVLPMTNKRDEYLNKMLGLDNASELLDQGIDAVVSALAANGIEHKSLDDDADKTDIAKAAITPIAKAMIDMAEDLASLDARVEKAESALATATKEATSSKTDFDAAVDALKELHAQFQAKLDAKPRSASRAAETEIENKDLDQDVADSLLVEDAVFGKVKPLES